MRLRLTLLVAATAAFFAIPVAVASAVPVTITLAGGGQGTVVSDSPVGIDCSNVGGGTPGPTCSTDLTDFGDFTATLAATPAEGSIFVGWTLVSGFPLSGCTTPAGDPPTCSPFLFGDTEVTATFEIPPDPPVATTDEASAGANDTLMTLNGRVDPGGNQTNGCRFVYGPTTDYGESTPCDQTSAEIGSGNGDVAVSASTAPLEPGAIYHYALRASNIGGADQGEDRTLTTAAAPADSCPNAAIRAEQGIKALALPDCMALEMATPPQKAQQFTRYPNVSIDGKRVLFNSIATLGDSRGLLDGVSGDLYVATRSSSGWTTAATSPAPPIATGASGARSFAPDFTRWSHLGSSRDQFPLGIYQAFRGGVDGAFAPVSPLLTPLTGPDVDPFLRVPKLAGTSEDRSRVYVTAPGAGDAIAGIKSATFLPGDPQPDGFGEDPNLYVAGLADDGQSSLELVARDRDGKAWGGNCGARLGGIQDAFGSDRYLRNGDRGQGAVASDGSRVYFSTRPDQPETGDCTDVPKMRIMVREETPTGPTIEELFESECDRVSPACSTDVGDDVYQGASVDQTKVYFTTNRQLADTDVDGSAESCSSGLGTAGEFQPSDVLGCDLYLYDSERPEGERLVQVSAGDETAATPGSGARVASSITAISADGSHVYFVAQTVLTTDPNPAGAVAQDAANNLYVYDADERELGFVGTLDPDDGGSFTHRDLFGVEQSTWTNYAYPVPILGTDSQGNEVGGDGHVLVFRAKAALTADDGDSARDLFRYDADAGTLEHVSKAAPGGSDDGDFDPDVPRGGSVGVPPNTAYAALGRWVSDDGETVVFSTAEALLPGDVNGAMDSYMWRDGTMFRLPFGSDKAGGTSTFPSHSTLSPDGDTVAFGSNQRLLPVDGDTVQDIYVARVGGGFPDTVDESDCDPAVGCQGAGAGPVATDEKSSSPGGGNAGPGARKRLTVGGLSAKARRRAARTGKLVLSVRANKAGRVTAVASARVGKRARRVASRSVRLSGPGSARLSLKLSRKAKAVLGHGGRLRLTVVVRSPGARSRSLGVTLKGAGK